MSSGEARFNYYGRTVPLNSNRDVSVIITGSTATVVIRDRAFNNFANLEWYCGGIYHYLFLSNGEHCSAQKKHVTYTFTNLVTLFRI